MIVPARQLGYVTIILVVMTVASTTLTLGVLGPHHRPIWSAVVFIIALVKARIVVARFMELRSAPIMKAFDMWFMMVACAYLLISR